MVASPCLDLPDKRLPHQYTCPFLLCALATLIIATPSAEAGAAPAAPERAPKRVLHVYSDERLLPANVIEDQATRGTFATDPGLRVAFYSEFLDVVRFGGEAHERRLTEFFREKYADRPPDLIMSSGQPALAFLLKHRATLFAGVPLVALGAVEQRAVQEVSDPRVVGVPNPPSFTSTIELALGLHPHAREIAVVAGAAPRDRTFVDAARRDLRPFEGRVSVRWLTNHSITDLKRELSSLPEHTVVLYLSMFGDQSDNSFPPRQAFEEFAPASRAPIYSIFDTLVGSGAVGGSIITFETMGQKAAEVGMRILAGMEPQDAIQGERYQPMPIFDWRQLRRAGIDEAELPAGSIVRFKEHSLWEQYRWHIIVVLSVCVAQMLLIAALLIQRRRRHQAEALRRESDERTRRAADAARESEKRFSLIADSAPVLIWMSGLDKLCSFVNRPWLEFTGRTFEQTLGIRMSSPSP